MSEEAEVRDDFSILRDKIAALRMPEASVEEFAGQLNEALLGAARCEAIIRRAPNHLDAAMSQALSVYLSAADAAHGFKALRERIGDMEAACKAASTAARVALSLSMAATGAPDTETETHTATPTEPVEKAVLDDVGALPPDCVEYVAEPKTKLIAAKLIAGQAVAGARLERGEPGIRVMRKKMRRGEVG